MNELSPKENSSSFLVPAEGHFAPDDVSIKITTQPKVLPDEVRHFVDENWQRAKAQNPNLFDSPVIALEDVEANGRVLVINSSLTDFKSYYVLSINPETKNKFREAAIPGIGIAALVLTEDNKVILSQRGRKTMSPGDVNTAPAGFVRVEDQADQTIIPFKTFARKLDDELGITVSDLKEIYCPGIVKDSKTNSVDILFFAKSNLTAEDILSKNHEGDVTLVAIPNEPLKLANEALRFTSITISTGLGAVYLFLKQFHGQRWADYFESRVRRREQVYRSVSKEKLQSFKKAKAAKFSIEDK